MSRHTLGFGDARLGLLENITVVTRRYTPAKRSCSPGSPRAGVRTSGG